MDTPTNTTPARRIVFVGPGSIGLPMALRLAGAGHDVVAVEPAPAARARAQRAGLPTRPLSGTDADLGIVMVATAAQLTAVVDEVVVEVLATGRGPAPVWVLMSTVGPEALRAQGERLVAAGAEVLDAPVTGGVAGAVAGRLTVFAAGDPATRRRVLPALAPLGRVREVGDELGRGQSVKLVNQHLCSVHLVAAAEALHLAAALGLDPAETLDLVSAGAAGSWMLGDRGPRMLGGTDVEVTSTVDIFVKDADLVTAAAADAAADVPLLDQARRRLAAAAAAGLGRRDDSRVIETYRAHRPVPSAEGSP